MLFLSLLNEVQHPAARTKHSANELRARELRHLVLQFHGDLQRIISATRDDDPCDEDHCRMFNTLVDQSIEVMQQPGYYGLNEMARLRALRLRPINPPLRERIPISALLSRTGHLKVMIEHKLEHSPSSHGGTSIVFYALLLAGSVGVVAFAGFILRLMMS